MQRVSVWCKEMKVHRKLHSGVAVLNMHAPWEVISKVDLYEAYRSYVAFLENA